MVIAFPILIIVATLPSASLFVRSAVIFLNDIGVLVCIFVPKVLTWSGFFTLGSRASPTGQVRSRDIDSSNVAASSGGSAEERWRSEGDIAGWSFDGGAKKRSAGNSAESSAESSAGTTVELRPPQKAVSKRGGNRVAPTPLISSASTPRDSDDGLEIKGGGVEE